MSGEGNVLPAIALTEPLLWARLEDGATSLAIAAVGWEIPLPHNDELDQWIVMRVRVQTPDRTWEAQASPFGFGAMSRLAAWSRRAATKPVPSLYFDDPELELLAPVPGVAEVTLRDLFVPDEVDAHGEGVTLRIECGTEALIDFSHAIEGQAAQLNAAL